MFDEWRYQLRLVKLQRGRAVTVQNFKELLEEMQREHRGKVAKRDVLERMEQETEEWDDEISQITTEYLLSQAHKYILPVPAHEDAEFWYKSKMYGIYLLSPKGVSRLRTDVRAEQKATWDFWQSRIMTMLALIGGIFGVLAYFKQH